MPYQSQRKDYWANSLDSNKINIGMRALDKEQSLQIEEFIRSILMAKDSLHIELLLVKSK